MIKNFNETLAEIKKITAEIEKLNSKINARAGEIHAIYETARANGRFNALPADIKARKDALNALDIKDSKKIYTLEIKRVLLKNNAKYFLYNACVPVICETLLKYANKPYGEKTAEKIRNEIKAVLPVYVYIYSNKISVDYAGITNDYNFEIALRNEYSDGARFLSADNKIMVNDPVNMFIAFSYTRLVDPDAGTIKTLQRKRDEITKLSKALYDCISEYNKMKTDFLPEMQYPPRVSNNVFYKN